MRCRSLCCSAPLGGLIERAELRHATQVNVGEHLMRTRPPSNRILEAQAAYHMRLNLGEHQHIVLLEVLPDVGDRWLAWQTPGVCHSSE
jgi:hypothetical protein